MKKLSNIEAELHIKKVFILLNDCKLGLEKNIFDFYVESVYIFQNKNTYELNFSLIIKDCCLFNSNMVIGMIIGTCDLSHLKMFLCLCECLCMK